MASPPARLAAAASNVIRKVIGAGVADLRPLPRALIDQGPTRAVYRFTPPAGSADGAPVLLVPPLAAPARCFDLRRGCSLVEHLVAQGFDVYLVDYGTVSFGDRHLGIEHWVEQVLPRAIRKVSEQAGGRGVHLVGWSLGGVFSLLTTADQPDLPVESVTSIAAPFDVAAIPLVAPLRPLVNLSRGYLVSPIYRLLGGAPAALVGRAFRLAGVEREITKPLAVLTHLDDRDYLAQLEAVDRFMDHMIAYPGRTFGQLYHRLFRANDLASGAIELGGRTIALADVKVPVLVVAGEGDGIAPRRSVEHLVGLLDNAPSVRFEVVPGGHLGSLTGRAARRTTWVYLDDFLSERILVG